MFGHRLHGHHRGQRLDGLHMHGVASDSRVRPEHQPGPCADAHSIRTLGHDHQCGHFERAGHNRLGVYRRHRQHVHHSQGSLRALALLWHRPTYPIHQSACQAQHAATSRRLR